MDDLEINDYLRRALESAGGQFSELSVSHHDHEEELIIDDSTFLTERPLTPKTAEKKQKSNIIVSNTDGKLRQIKAQKASKLVGVACDEMKLNNFLVAQAKLNRAIQMKGDNPNYFMLRGECCLQLSEFKESILNYNHAIDISTESAFEWVQRLGYIHFLYSQILFDEHDFGAALVNVNHALQYQPGKFSYTCRKIAYLYSLKQHKTCLELVEQLLESHDEAELYVLRARLNKLFGHITKCFYDVHKALDIDPDNMQATKIVNELNKSAEDCRSVAVNQALAGNLPEAISKITVSIDTNPTIAEYTVFRGTLFRQQGQYDDAIDDFMRALSKVNEGTKTSQDAMRQLVLTYNDFAIECYSKGYYEEAISLLDQAIKRERNEKGFYLNRGDSFRMIGYLSFGLADYQQALELDPHDWVIISRISLVHHQYGIKEYTNKHYSEAEKCFTTAITCNAKIAQYYISRAWSRFMQKHLPASRADLLRAMYLDNTIEEGIMLAARLYPNQNIDSILAAKSSQKILNQMRELVAGELDQDNDQVVLSSNTLAHEPLAKENIAQFNGWMDKYKQGNSSVKTLLNTRPQLGQRVPKIIPSEKISQRASDATGWMKKYFESNPPNQVR